MENLRAGEESKINNLFYLMGWSVTVTRWEWMRRIVHCQILTEGCTQRRPPFPSHLSAPVFFLSCAQLNICTPSHFIHTHTDLHICTHTHTHAHFHFSHVMMLCKVKIFQFLNLSYIPTNLKKV